MIKLSKEQLEYLRRNVNAKTWSEMALHLGLYSWTLINIAKRHGISRDTKCNEVFKLGSLFKKGHSVKRKKYQYRPIGTVYKKRVRGKKMLLILYKRGKNNQVLFQEYKKWLYEKHFGPVPKGFKVIVANGDELDVRPDNLALKRKGYAADKNDKFIAACIARKNRELQRDLLKMPELLEIKRLQLELNREIKKCQ